MSAQTCGAQVCADTNFLRPVSPLRFVSALTDGVALCADTNWLRPSVRRFVSAITCGIAVCADRNTGRAAGMDRKVRSDSKAFGDDRPDVRVEGHAEVGAAHLEILDVRGVVVNAGAA